MLNEENDFIEALEFFLKAELRASAEPADYNNEAIRIIDARNHLFQNVGAAARTRNVAFMPFATCATLMRTRSKPCPTACGWLPWRMRWVYRANSLTLTTTH